MRELIKKSYNSIINTNEEVEVRLNSQLASVTAEQARTEGRSSELSKLVDKMRTTRTSINKNYKAIAELKAMQDNFVLFKRHFFIASIIWFVAGTLLNGYLAKIYLKIDYIKGIVLWLLTLIVSSTAGFVLTSLSLFLIRTLK